MSTALKTVAQISVGTAAVLVFSAPLDNVQLISFECPSTNSGSVFIGDSFVANDESRGHKIAASGVFSIQGQNTRAGGGDFINTQYIYAIASAASQKLNVVMLVKNAG